jgi:two-component system cell cycle sensor histidine kinase/response regulator CckA
LETAISTEAYSASTRGTTSPLWSGVRERSKTILVVDDDPSVRELMAMILEAEGYRVLRAGHSQEALHISREFPGHLDMLLTDFCMRPYPNGFELAQWMRAERPGIGVAYVSGYVENGVLQTELESSAAAFLAKPFTPASLLHCVRQVLGVPA